MIIRASPQSFIKPKIKRFLVGAVLCLGLALAAFIPAYAEDPDPFQFDTGKWMSFDRYKDNTKRKNLAPLLNDDQTPPNDTVAAPPPPAPTVTEAAKVAEPTRPISTPLLPGINKGFGIHVQSTSDEEPSPTAPLVNLSTNPDLNLKEHNWQNAKEIDRLMSKMQPQTAGDGETQSKLEIRETYLPNRKVAPVTAPPPYKHKRQTPAAAAQQTPTEDKPVAPKSPQEAAACAAIDAYKKQKLDAIQSDRQTLEALQSAITQLGLSKELNFLTDVKGNLNTQNQTPAPKTDAAVVGKP